VKILADRAASSLWYGPKTRDRGVSARHDGL